MKAIQANPKTVRETFTSSYIIPEFQRPYSWGAEQCDKLFEDITEFFRQYNDSENKYYLGSIIVYKDGKSWAVIDGQQRLTSLVLFLHALSACAGTVPALEECIKVKDSLSGKLREELKLVSLVIEQDREELEKLIFHDEIAGTERFWRNYNRFYDDIRAFFSGVSAEERSKFILTVLDRVVLLPIECGSMDDALTIFDTVNNRGVPLSDVDIFKAKLFRNAGKAGVQEFMRRWNGLLGDGETEELLPLFRYFMHIKRAEQGNTDSEIALRAYFDNGTIFKDWQEVLTALEKISYFYYNPNILSAEAYSAYWTLQQLPHDYWSYPIFTFWFKFAEKQDDDWILPDKKQAEADKLAETTLRYYYLNAVAYNNIGRVKHTTYQVCKAIWAEEDYSAIYANNSGNSGEALRRFEENIKDCNYGRARNGLVALVSMLNPKQDINKWAYIEEFEVEHILPRNGAYANYNGWTEDECWDCLDTLGNYVSLEKARNIAAKNFFFQKKQKSYEGSAYQDARDLCKLEDWTYAEWEKREKQCEDRLFKFFGIKPKAEAAE